MRRRRIKLKTYEEIELLRASNLLVSETHREIAKIIGPGVNLLELDKIGETFIRDNGGRPAFLGYNGFPNTFCMSLNEAVVHGIPSDYMLQEGDIISIDCGVELNGYFGDSAFTYAIGEIDEESQKLLEVTEQSLYLGIEEAKVGNRIGDISFAIQNHVEREHGFGIVRELVGHGIGQDLHEAPEVPNYGKRGRGAKIENGLVIAIEPMVNAGSKSVRQLKDGWTIVTKDGKNSAHFEHSIAVWDGQPIILSDHKIIKEELKKNASITQFSENL